MPFRSIAVLQSWVHDFEQLAPSAGGDIRVIPQDGEGGDDTGLIAVRLPNSPTEIYLEPPTPTQVEWTVMFEPREQPVRLGSSQIRTMAEEMAVLAELCASLQQRSDAFRAQRAAAPGEHA
jgi:hypothetical protein